MSQPSFAKFAVLVADPSEHMANIVASMLRAIGVNDVFIATTAKAAATELKRRSFDALIIDTDLKSDAVALVKALRANEISPNRLIPVVMTSSLPDADRITAARDAGITEFLRKPFAANHLLTRLRSIRENPRAFVESTVYTGPDRRRRTEKFAGGERRS